MLSRCYLEWDKLSERSQHRNGNTIKGREDERSNAIWNNFSI